MAYIKMRPDRPKHPWVVIWTDPNTGRRRSAAFATRPQARRFHEEIDRHVWDLKLRRRAGLTP